jgi:diaminohydroxyphosphoribosylaminopyrimidine deaminase/5-amino-6-(5-phosphoribosylamino)uracil reductase
MLSAFQFLWAQPPSGLMGEALRAAVPSVGRTCPNPAVGCVVVDDNGAVIARGGTEPAGKRHAEVVALDALPAGAARGKTLYATLEPCSHHGRTPPCADRIVREGVARVVVGAIDPNPLVHQQGVARLRAAGVDVDVVGADSVDGHWCAALLRPFARSMAAKVSGAAPRPYVVVKVATSLDGKVATRTGASRFITGPESRRLVHRLRNVVDAVAVGAGTVAVDDPHLGVRDVAAGSAPVRDPLRVLFDRQRRFTPARAPHLQIYRDARALHVDAADVHAALAVVAAVPVVSLLVEAGPTLAAAFLRAGVVDELWWFHAPIVVGDDGRGASASLDVDVLGDAHAFDVVDRVVCGVDVLTVLVPRA